MEALKESGFEAIGTSDGFDALAKLKARPDVRDVITDIRMPYIGEALFAAMAQARNPSLRALINGYPDEAFKLPQIDKWPFLPAIRLSKLAQELCQWHSKQVDRNA